MISPQQRKLLYSISFDCRYNLQAATDLMARAGKIQKISIWLLLIGLFGSMTTGLFFWGGEQAEKAIWGTINAISVIISVYILVMAYSENQQTHHAIAKDFESLAMQAEYFALFGVDVGPVKSDEIDKRAAQFAREMMNLMNKTGPEHKKYCVSNGAEIQKIVTKELKQRGLVKDDVELAADDQVQKERTHERDGSKASSSSDTSEAKT